MNDGHIIKWCKPDNPLKLSFTNIWGLPSNFAECESFLESNSSSILVLCETNLDYSIDSDNFSVRDFLPSIQNDSITHLHSLTVYVKEGLPFAWYLSLGNSVDSYLCFWLALLHSVSYFFFLSQSLLCCYAEFLIPSHLTYLRFSWSTHLLMCLSLGTFASIIKDWLTYSGLSDRLGELCCNFSIWSNLS